MMDLIFPLTLVALSSAGAYRLARPRFALRPIADAVQMLVDCMGVCVLFLAFNIFAGGLTILLIRSLTPISVSLYTLDNIVLPVLSVVQGLIFRFWWQHD